MTTKELYKCILLEKECIRNRVSCNKNCKACNIKINLMEQDLALTNLIDIVRARDPELYFVHSLEQLIDSLSQ